MRESFCRIELNLINMLFMSLLLVSCSHIDRAKEEGKSILKEERMDSESYKLYIYKSITPKCFSMWYVYEFKEKGGKTLELRVDLKDKKNCEISSAQKMEHEKVLKRIFLEHKAEEFSSFISPSLERITFNKSSNLLLAQFAAMDALWKDYTKNYPNHKSQKSSNEIFKEAVLRTKADSELLSLLKPYFLKVELKHVEKVFAMRAKDLSFYKDLKNSKTKSRLYYDAGNFEYSLSTK